MKFPTRFFFLAVGFGLLSASCVSKKNYFSVLEQAEAAKSELSQSSTDLEGATRRTEEQRLVIAGLAAEIQQLRESAQENSTAALGERQQLGSTLSTLQYQLDQQQLVIDDRNAQRQELLALLKDFELRFQGIRAKLSEATSALPVGQYSLRQNGDYVELKLDEALLFGGSKTVISSYGDEVLTRIASALGGQSDLQISIVASPNRKEASQANALGNAAIRAGIVAENLTITHGLSPKLVSAAAREDVLVIVDGAPAESVGAHRFSFIVRINRAVSNEVRAILSRD